MFVNQINWSRSATSYYRRLARFLVVHHHYHSRRGQRYRETSWAWPRYPARACNFLSNFHCTCEPKLHSWLASVSGLRITIVLRGNAPPEKSGHRAVREMA